MLIPVFANERTRNHKGKDTDAQSTQRKGVVNAASIVTVQSCINKDDVSRIPQSQASKYYDHENPVPLH